MSEIQAKFGIESSEPIAIAINVPEFRDDRDDRGGDAGRVAVDDDQLRTRRIPPLASPYSVRNPRFRRTGKRTHEEPQRVGLCIALALPDTRDARDAFISRTKHGEVIIDQRSRKRSLIFREGKKLSQIFLT